MGHECHKVLCKIRFDYVFIGRECIAFCDFSNHSPTPVLFHLLVGGGDVGWELRIIGLGHSKTVVVQEQNLLSGG